jgi:hypothetical protein
MSIQFPFQQIACQQTLTRRRRDSTVPRGIDTMRVERTADPQAGASGI